MERVCANAFTNCAAEQSTVLLEEEWIDIWIADTKRAIGDANKMEAQMKLLQAILDVPFLGNAHTKRCVRESALHTCSYERTNTTPL